MLESLVKKIIAPIVVAGSLCLSSQTSVNAQEHSRPITKEVYISLGANIVYNAIIGGIGAKKNNQKFIDGMWKGAVGGALIGAGKYVASNNQKFAWPGRLIVWTGNSIVYNVVQGKPPLSTYYCTLGPLSLSVGKEGVKPRASLAGIVAIAAGYATGGHIDLKTSLRFGTTVFTGGKLRERGFALGNGFSIDRREEDFGPVSNHENIHTLQASSFYGVGHLILQLKPFKDLNNLLGNNKNRPKSPLRWLDVEGELGYMASYLPFLPLHLSNPLEYEARCLSGTSDE